MPAVWVDETVGPEGRPEDDEAPFLHRRLRLCRQQDGCLRQKLMLEYVHNEQRT